MKTVEQLAREAGHPQPGMDKIFFQRLVDLAIAQYRESLLAGVGDAVLWLDEEKKVLYEHNTHEVDAYHGFTPTTPLYTADQMAAAVAIERERCAKEAADHCWETGCLAEAAIRGAAMTPTPELRFVEREIKTPDGNEGACVLQQKWEQREWAHDQEIVTAEEWRDVPLVKGDV